MSSHISREKREKGILLHKQGYSYRQIGEKLGISPATVWNWVSKFAVENQSVMKKKSTLVSKRLVGVTAPESSVMSSTVSKSSETDAQKIARLERELLESRMLSDIYNEIINVAEEKFNIQIRKKLAPSNEKPACTISQEVPNRGDVQIVWC